MLKWQGQIKDFFIRGAPKLRTNISSAPVGWVQGVSNGDVPPQKWRKNSIFEAN